MKNRKGFISISVIYTFFIVFLLIMLSMLAAYLNKRFLKNQILEDFPYDESCNVGEPLTDCLFKAEAHYAKEFDDSSNTYYDALKNANEYDVAEIKAKIGSRNPPTSEELIQGAGGPQSMYAQYDDSGKKSYFYRGNVENNYVSLDGLLWRIVRINGDESTRLIFTGIDDNSNTAAKATQLRNYFYASPTGGAVSDSFLGNIMDCVFSYNSTVYQPRSGSLRTVFDRAKDNDNHFFCSDDSNKYTVGLMKADYGLFSGNAWADLRNEPDTVMGNDKPSAILSGLYSFYEYLSTTAKNKIYGGSVFCADKGIESDGENKDTFKNILCEGAFFNSFCNSGFLNWQASDMTVYQAWKRINNGGASLVCADSGRNVNEAKFRGLREFLGTNFNCFKNLNLSSYSWKESNGKAIYDVSSIQDSCMHEVGLGILTEKHWEVRDRYHKLKNLYENSQSKVTDNSYSKEYGNGALDYPIGLISADEVMLSGVGFNSNNSSISSEEIPYYWTGTVAYGDYNGTITNYLQVDDKFDNLTDYNIHGNYTSTLKATYYYIAGQNGLEVAIGSYLNNDSSDIYSRPVISLKKECTYADGAGTKENPYKIGDCS